VTDGVPPCALRRCDPAWTGTRRTAGPDAARRAPTTTTSGSIRSPPTSRVCARLRGDRRPGPLGPTRRAAEVLKSHVIRRSPAAGLVCDDTTATSVRSRTISSSIVAVDRGQRGACALRAASPRRHGRARAMQRRLLLAAREPALGWSRSSATSSWRPARCRPRSPRPAGLPAGAPRPCSRRA